MLVLSCSSALMELFPEMYKKIVQLASSDWKILVKQIGLENPHTGSPVLAVFTSGSLCAMMAFACPLENLLYILAGSHLLSVIFRGIYLLYIPFKPKILEVISKDNSSSLNYSRLESEINPQAAAAGTSSSALKLSTSIRKLWNMTKSESVNFPRRQLSPQEHLEMEREWLLLGEPPMSPPSVRNENEFIIDTKLIGTEEIAAGEEQEHDLSDESSTDIDAIVHEYMEKVRVTTGGPLEANVLRIPSASSWRLALFLMFILLCAVSLLDLGIYQQSVPYLVTGAVAIVVITGLLVWLPKHVNQKQDEFQNVLISVITLCGALVLMMATLSQSWPALLFWLVAGLSLIIRCDQWCCPCLDKTEDVTLIQEPIYASTHQLYLSETQPTLVIGGGAGGSNNPMTAKGHLIATRMKGR